VLKNWVVPNADQFVKINAQRCHGEA